MGICNILRVKNVDRERERERERRKGNIGEGEEVNGKEI